MTLHMHGISPELGTHSDGAESTITSIICLFPDEEENYYSIAALRSQVPQTVTMASHSQPSSYWDGLFLFMISSTRPPGMRPLASDGEKTRSLALFGIPSPLGAFLGRNSLFGCFSPSVAMFL